MAKSLFNNLSRDEVFAIIKNSCDSVLTDHDLTDDNFYGEVEGHLGYINHMVGNHKVCMRITATVKRDNNWNYKTRFTFRVADYYSTNLNAQQQSVTIIIDHKANEADVKLAFKSKHGRFNVVLAAIEKDLDEKARVNQMNEERIEKTKAIASKCADIIGATDSHGARVTSNGIHIEASATSAKVSFNLGEADLEKLAQIQAILNS